MPGSARPVWILGFVALAAAGAGLVTGVSQTSREVQGHGRRPLPSAPAPSARSYADMRAARFGPNARMYDGAFDRLAAAGPGLHDPVEQSEVDRQAARAERARRRAYDGAPPTIPHAIDQQAAPDCLACHEAGAKIGGRVAPRMSHARHDSCVQCHVVAGDPRPVASTPPAPENAFVGLASPASGTRAWPGAPPTIPHSTLMRGECTSCHGLFGRSGMRSTHPWRQSCTQCHAPSAALDQRPRAGAPAPVGWAP
jgi:cytochrome c-type protein NapB